METVSGNPIFLKLSRKKQAPLQALTSADTVPQGEVQETSETSCLPVYRGSGYAAKGLQDHSF